MVGGGSIKIAIAGCISGPSHPTGSDYCRPACKACVERNQLEMGADSCDTACVRTDTKRQSYKFPCVLSRVSLRLRQLGMYLGTSNTKRRPQHGLTQYNYC